MNHNHRNNLELCFITTSQNKKLNRSVHCLSIKITFKSLILTIAKRRQL